MAARGPLSAGDRLGRYEVVGSLGAGGSGDVYEALMHGPGGLRKRVALKVLAATGDRVRREARIGGLLRHAHLVDVYEVDLQDGRWFCALELCPGGAIDRWVPLPPRAVVDVGLQVCAALQYAHEELGLVHLDLKPTNLLLKDGAVKVADLGIARARGFDDDGRVHGTPGYMSPEQRSGLPVDVRSDVYSLGVVLQELAGGGAPTPLRTFGPDTDAHLPVVRPPVVEVDWLAPVVARCTDPHPDARFPTMSALAAALRALTAVGPTLLEVCGDAPVASVRLAGTNVTPEGDRTVGRADLLAELSSRLARPGLWTLRGPAGIGKTRIAREIAGSWHRATGEQAWFCDLASATSASEVLATVAATLDVRRVSSSEDELAVQLGHALNGRGAVLLVLDNFEQVAAAAPLVGRWRAQAPSARILVTSRVGLAVDGEVLDLPPLADADAVDLLVDRARARGAEVGDDAALVGLARRLDGLPLALELAAGRLGVLRPQEVLDRLSLSLLRSDRADDDRQSTLGRAIAWSFGLLRPDEQRALANLSVFAGAFTLEAAEEVVGAGLDVIQRLVESSLVHPAADGRFELLQTIREYAATELHGEARAAAEGRHARWYARYGDDEPLRALHGHGGAERSRALVRALADLVAATRSALRAGDGPTAVRAALAASQAFELRTASAEWPAFLREVSGCAVDRALAARRARAEGNAFHAFSRYDEARRRYEQALEDARELGDRPLQVDLLQRLGQVELVGGRTAEARAPLEESLAVSRAIGSRYGQGMTLARLAVLDRLEGRLEAEARSLEAIALLRECGSRRGEAEVLSSFATFLKERGRLEEAKAVGESALLAFRDVGDRPSEAGVLLNLGNQLFQRGRSEERRAFYDAALAITREAGDRRREGFVLANLGNLHFERGDLGLARQRYVESVAILQELGDRRTEGIVTGNLAQVQFFEGHVDAAEGTFQRALQLRRAAGDDWALGSALGHLAQVQHARGRLEEALQLFAEGLAHDRAVRNRRSEGQLLADLGACLAESGRPEEARLRCEEALEVLREVGLRRPEALTLGHLAGLRRSVTLYEQALALIREVGDVGSEARLLVGLAELQVGDEAAASVALAERLIGGLDSRPANVVAGIARVRARVEGPADGSGDTPPPAWTPSSR